ncbi:MAG: hypothetical protein GC162_18060 [Planctomycetes bacterium]|nr:hypothetical protein [Planctomycetota bacterium]
MFGCGHRLGWVLCCAAMLAAGSAAAGADKPGGPLSLEVHRFDFEEQKLGNFEPMPMHWFRVDGTGFPRYTQMGFDNAQSVSADHSFKLALNGGSAAALLEAGTLVAVPQARYLITANIRTEDARYSRARLVAYFVDQHGREVPQSRRATAPILSNGAWTTVAIQLPDTPDNAAWVVLRVELLQSSFFHSRLLEEHQLIEQDIRASAWFDDIVVYQMPMISIATQTPLNVIRQPQQPAIASRVHDVTGQPLHAQIEVTDAGGRIIDRQERDIDVNHPGEWEWKPNVPGLGWYRAQLTVMTGSQIVGGAGVTFVWLGPTTERGQGEAGRFIITAEHLTQAQRNRLPDLLKSLGNMGVSVSPWSMDMTQDELAAAVDAPDPLLNSLLLSNRHVILSFAEVPRDLAGSVGVDADDALALMAHDAKLWQPYIQSMLARYGLRLSDYQVGASGSGAAFERDDLAAIFPPINDLFHRYVPHARVLLPWRAIDEMPADPPAFDAWNIDFPVSIHADQFQAYAKTWKIAPEQMIYHLQTLPPHVYSARDRGADLAFRMLEAWRLVPQAIAIRRPWTSPAGDGGDVQPDPILPVWANMIEQLSGRRYVGQMEIREGIRCYLLDGPSGPRGGALVMWNESSPDADAELDLYLGPDPVAIDMLGNRRPLDRVGEKQRVRLAQEPTFIEGVDMRLARFRAGFHIDPTFAPSVHTVHEHTLTLVNPWPQSLNGHLRFTSPESWDIEPHSLNFSIPAGQTYRVPLAFSFPASELSGTTLITAHVDLDADKSYQLDVASPIRIGLENIDFKSNLNVESDDHGDKFLLLTMIVTNLGDASQAFYAFSLPPDLPRQQRIIADLAPGQTVLKHFRVPYDPAMSGKTLRLGLRQIDGPAVLNALHPIP